MPLTDLPGILPASVTVTFPSALDNAPQEPPYIVTVTLASLALAEFAGVTTNAGSKPLQSSCVAAFTADVPATPTNDAELDALAEQMATDWYRWQLSAANIAYAGACPWVLSGLEDAVEWTWETPEPHTRVIRPPLNDFNTGPLGLHSGSGGSRVTHIYNVWINNVTVTNTFNFFDVYVYVDARTFWIDNSTHINNYYWYFGFTDPMVLVNDVCYVEQTLEKAVTGTTALTNDTWTDLTGSSQTFTLEAESVVTVDAIFDLDGNNTATAGDTFDGAIMIDGARTNHIAILTVASAKNRATVATNAKATLAAGSHTIKLQGRMESGGTGPGLANTNSRWKMNSESRVIVSYRTVYLPRGLQYSRPFCVAAANNCCDPETSGTGNGCGDEACFFCEQEPETYTVTLAGFTDCPSGLDPNGDYTLTKTANCTWEGSNGEVTLRLTIVGAFAGIDTPGVRFILQSIDPLTSGVTGDILYTNTTIIPGATVDCCASVVLNRINVDGPPSDDIVFTDCCPDGLPNTMTATISDGTGGCECMDGEYTLLPSGSGGDASWVGQGQVCGEGDAGVMVIVVSCSFCFPPAPDGHLCVHFRCGGDEGEGWVSVTPTSDCASATFVWENISVDVPCCDGTFKLTVVGDPVVGGGGCTGPSTLTITPHNCGCGGDVEVEVDCCPDPLPSTLVGTFTNKTGYAAANFPDTVAFVNTGTTGWQWQLDENVKELTITCNGVTVDDWDLTSGGSAIGPASQNIDAGGDCSPLLLVWTVSGTFFYGASSYTLTITDE